MPPAAASPREQEIILFFSVAGGRGGRHFGTGIRFFSGLAIVEDAVEKAVGEGADAGHGIEELPRLERAPGREGEKLCQHHIHAPEKAEADTLFHPRSRAAIADLAQWGFEDLFRPRASHRHPGDMKMIRNRAVVLTLYRTCFHNGA